MRIAVCDDDIKILRIVKNYIGNYATLSGVQIDIELFDKAQGLLTMLESPGYNSYSAFFLDIAMEPVNGLDLAKKIKEKNAKAQIIFITGLSRHMQDAFRLHAFDYVLKPISQERINDVLDDLNIPSAKITIISDRREISVSLDDVIYLETFKNKTVFKLDKTEYPTYQPQIKIKAALPETFCQCHKSYIVNMNKIYERSKGECVLSNGVVLPIGRKYAGEFKERYFKYLRERRN